MRVHDLVPEAVWRPRYRVNDFEHRVGSRGYAHRQVLPAHLREEQQRRFEKRKQRPDKRWKYNEADEVEAKYWDDYQAAFRDAISQTSTAEAPWYVIPADNKWYRNWAVVSTLVDTLKDMDPQFPT